MKSTLLAWSGALGLLQVLLLANSGFGMINAYIGLMRTVESPRLGIGEVFLAGFGVAFANTVVGVFVLALGVDAARKALWGDDEKAAANMMVAGALVLSNFVLGMIGGVATWVFS